MTRIVAWFSAGAASAVAVKMLQARIARDNEDAELRIVRIPLANEHPDNERFAAECREWFGQPIIERSSARYADCWEVWESRRFLVSPKGAPCTTVMKKMVRHDFAAEWSPDLQAFGFTAEETERADQFRRQNPEAGLVTPLISAGLTKADCLAMIERAGIELPAMYRMGYRNNNCIGCVKGGVGYWNKIRVDFPETFARMARLERSIGATICKMPTGDRARVYLDALDPAEGRGVPLPDIECSLLCVSAEQDIAA